MTSAGHDYHERTAKAGGHQREVSWVARGREWGGRRGVGPERRAMASGLEAPVCSSLRCSSGMPVAASALFAPDFGVFAPPSGAPTSGVSHFSGMAFVALVLPRDTCRPVLLRSLANKSAGGATDVRGDDDGMYSVVQVQVVDNRIGGYVPSPSTMGEWGKRGCLGGEGGEEGGCVGGKGVRRRAVGGGLGRGRGEEGGRYSVRGSQKACPRRRGRTRLRCSSAVAPRGSSREG